jgi:hypothetical protein
MLHYRRLMMIALAVAMVCLLAGVHGCGGTGGTTVGSASQATTTEFSSSASGSNTDLGSQQQAMITGTQMVPETQIKIGGNLSRYYTLQLGGLIHYVTEELEINGYMWSNGPIGPSVAFSGTAEVTFNQHSDIVVKDQGTGWGRWTGTDEGAVLRALPMTSGTLYSASGFSGEGSISYKCKGEGRGQWPGGKEAPSDLEEVSGTIDFIITIQAGHITVAVAGTDWTGSLTGWY